MNNWAVIKTGGKQYKVEEGQVIEVEKLNLAKDAPVSFDQILAAAKEGKTIVGTPYIEKAKATGKVLDTFKDKKVRVVKFKPKSRYLRTHGHRQSKTKVLIEKIQL